MDGLKESMDTVLADPKERQDYAWAVARGALVSYLDAGGSWSDVLVMLRSLVRDSGADVMAAALGETRSVLNSAARLEDSLR